MESRRSLHTPSAREWAFLGMFLVAVVIAYPMFDEWRRPIEAIFQIGICGFILFFGGRLFWSWWSSQPDTTATKGMGLSFAVALAGWLVVSIARFVTHMSEGNYALIIIVPLTMMLGALAALAGLLAAALGLAIAVTPLTRPVPRPALLVVGGLACFLFNVAHILALVLAFRRA